MATNDIREFIKKVELADLLHLAWKETNLTPAQMEEAWLVIKSVLLDAVLVSEIEYPKNAVPLTEVLNRPEHVELQYQKAQGSLLKNNGWICSICGKDTSKVEYDYMVGIDHLECVLNKELFEKGPVEEEKPNKLEIGEESTKKVKKEKMVENSNREEKTFLELLSRGEYQTPKG